MGKQDELIVGIPRNELFSPGQYIRGFERYGAVVEECLVRMRRHMAFRYRSQCEDDPTFKQFIPYCLITRGDEIFMVRRLSKSTETRLHDKHSVGIGGHMNPEPGVHIDFKELLQRNMDRELDEEVVIQRRSSEYDLPREIFGMVNFDGDPVGAVHIGIVYRIYVEAGVEVEVNEPENMVGGFVSLDEARRAPNLETWSEACIKGLMGK
ncbi:MAG: hypothetical protein JEZ11_17855 [Desulfobacterales bacterium]|nr:hypothetical protein [Desulfobacterales bacterium]